MYTTKHTLTPTQKFLNGQNQKDCHVFFILKDYWSNVLNPFGNKHIWGWNLGICILTEHPIVIFEESIKQVWKLWTRPVYDVGSQTQKRRLATLGQRGHFPISPIFLFAS